ANDEANSSAPVGAIQPPTAPFTLQPGETRTVPVVVTLPRDPGLLPTTYHAALTARSVLDRQISAASAVDLVFAPRQLADLGLTVALPAGAIQEGTEAFVPVTVENHGLRASVPSRLHVEDVWVEGGTTTATDLEIPAIESFYAKPDESARVLEYHWRPAKGALGEHVLRFVADPDVLGEEYTRADNLVEIHANVTALLIPDLDITNASAVRVKDATGMPVEPSRDAD